MDQIAVTLSFEERGRRRASIQSTDICLARSDTWIFSEEWHLTVTPEPNPTVYSAVAQGRTGPNGLPLKQNSCRSAERAFEEERQEASERETRAKPLAVS